MSPGGSTQTLRAWDTHSNADRGRVLELVIGMLEPKQSVVSGASLASWRRMDGHQIAMLGKGGSAHLAACFRRYRLLLLARAVLGLVVEQVVDSHARAAVVRRVAGGCSAPKGVTRHGCGTGYQLPMRFIAVQTCDGGWCRDRAGGCPQPVATLSAPQS